MIAGNPWRSPTEARGGWAGNDPWSDPWRKETQREAMERRRWERMMAELKVAAEAAAVKLDRARYESQQAFRRPPKKCGRGRPPPKKWDTKPPRSRRRRGQKR